MRATYFQAPALAVLTILAVTCGGKSSPAPTSTPAPACVPSSHPEFAYTLTGSNFSQNGSIASYTVNSCTGSLIATTPPVVATGSDPEDMVVDPLGRFAYAANLVSNASDLATISMYTINSSTGALAPTRPATVPTGFFPQGIGIDPSSKFVYTANSDDNTVSMFTINQTTGVLTPTTPPTVATGWSPLSITVHPSGTFAYAANQDDGTISMYTVNPTTGVLTPTTPSTVPTGESPFGVTVAPSGKFAYAPNTYSEDNSVSEYTVDANTGVLTPTPTVVAIAGNQPTAVAVDSTSRFAYVTNRLDGTVSMFTINQSTGDLSQNGTIPAGSSPFRAVFDPSGKFLYVANEGSAASIYTLNSDGTLTAAGTTAEGSLAIALTAAQQ